MIRKWFWGLLWTMVLAAALQGQSRESVLKAVQQQSSTWSPTDKPFTYDEKNIDALAGKRAAAAINRYGLSGVTTQTWSGPEGTVHLTLYEMIDATAAYGLFTIDRNIDQPGFATIPAGTEGFRVGNRAEFWQSKYVVKLEGSVSAVNVLSRMVSENIFGQSRRPPVSTHLPPANLIQGSEKYIVDPAGLGHGVDLTAQSLGFDDSVEIATADYRVNGKVAHVVLLMYPTQQIAKKYEDQWAAASAEDAAFRKRVGALLALVRGSRDLEVAKTI